MATFRAFRGKYPALFLTFVACQEGLSHSGTDWQKPPTLRRFTLVDEVAVACPVHVLPAHPEHLLLVAHSGIAHDHQHIAKRLFTERQKLGFDVSIDDG
jgi:hypothetical protein